MWPAQWYWGHCRELESQLVGYNSFCLRVCVALMFAKTYWAIKSYLTAFTSASPACIIDFVFYIHYLHFLGYHITKWAVTCCILIFLKVAKTKAGVCCEMWKWLYRHFYACITVCWECSTIILLVIWVNLCFVFVLHIFILYFETVLDSFVSFWKHQVNSDLKWNICEYSYLFINIYSKATMFNVVIYLLHPSKSLKTVFIICSALWFWARIHIKALPIWPLTLASVTPALRPAVAPGPHLGVRPSHEDPGHGHGGGSRRGRRPGENEGDTGPWDTSV